MVQKQKERKMPNAESRKVNLAAIPHSPAERLRILHALAEREELARLLRSKPATVMFPITINGVLTHRPYSWGEMRGTECRRSAAKQKGGKKK